MNQYTESDALPIQSSNTTPPSNPIVQQAAASSGILYEQRNKKGLLIIFNHFQVFPHERKKARPTPRHGTEVDVENLKSCFGGLNYDIEDHNESTHHKILRALNDVACRDHTNTSCIAVVLMTHGDTGELVLAADKKYRVSDLWQQFEQAQNKTLYGKPKLFFVQACRGYQTDDGVVVTDAMSTAGAQMMIPTRADYLIMYSTVEETSAFRDSAGSWFISALCHELRHHAARDLLQILTAVNHKIAYERYSYNPQNAELHHKKQMPQIVSMLTKHLFFN